MTNNKFNLYKNTNQKSNQQNNTPLEYEILSTNALEYMNWLEEYTKEESCITTNMYLLKEEMSQKEIAYTSILNQLFEIINNYSNQNYIYPQTNKYGTYYRIKYNNIGYNIGYFRNQSPNIYFCIKINLNPQKEYIDFNDILENKQLPRTVQIKQELQQLSNLIHTLSDHNIPLEAISDTSKNTIKKIRKLQSNNPNQNK